MTSASGNKSVPNKTFNGIHSTHDTKLLSVGKVIIVEGKRSNFTLNRLVKNKCMFTNSSLLSIATNHALNMTDYTFLSCDASGANRTDKRGRKSN